MIENSAFLGGLYVSVDADITGFMTKMSAVTARLRQMRRECTMLTSAVGGVSAGGVGRIPKTTGTLPGGNTNNNNTKPPRGSGGNRTFAGLGTALLMSRAARSMRDYVGSTVADSRALETAFTGILKTMDPTVAQTELLREQFAKMAVEIPIVIEDLYGIGESAGQLGVAFEHVEQFSRVIAGLSVTTNLSAEKAAKQLARFANITKTAQTDFDRLGAVIVALGNNFATTESEIVNMGMRLGATGRLLNMSAEDVLGFSAALSSVGVTAELGGSAMARIWLTMATAAETGDEKLSVFAETAGVTSEEFSRLARVMPSEAFIAFVSGLDDLQKRTGSVNAVLEDLEFNSVRVGRVIRSATTGVELMRGALKMARAEWELNTALLREQELRFGTLDSKVQLLKNRYRLFASSMGDSLRPTLLKAIDALTSLVTWVARLSNQQKEMAMIGIVLASVALSITAVGTAVGFLVAAFGGTAVVAILTGFVAMLASVLAVGNAIGRLQMSAGKSRDEINFLSDATMRLTDQMHSFVREKVTDAFLAAAQVVIDAWGDVLDFFESLPDRVADAIRNLPNKVSGAMQKDTNITRGITEGPRMLWEQLKKSNEKSMGLSMFIPDIVAGVEDGIRIGMETYSSADNPAVGGGLFSLGRDSFYARYRDALRERSDSLQSARDARRAEKQMESENALTAHVAALKETTRILEGAFGKDKSAFAEQIRNIELAALARDTAARDQAVADIQKMFVSAIDAGLATTNTDVRSMLKDATSGLKATMEETIRLFDQVNQEMPGALSAYDQWMSALDQEFLDLDFRTMGYEGQKEISAIKKRAEEKAKQAQDEAAYRERMLNKKAVDMMLRVQDRPQTMFRQIAISRFSIAGLAGNVNKHRQSVVAEGVERRLDTLIDVTRNNRPLAVA